MGGRYLISLIIKKKDNVLHRKKIIAHSSFKFFIDNLLKIMSEQTNKKNMNANDIFKSYCKDLAISNHRLKGVFDMDLWTKDDLQKYIVKENISIEVITKREKSVFYF